MLLLPALKLRQPLPPGEWRAQLERWKQQHPLRMKPSALSPQAILQAVNHCFEDAIIATDVGQNQLCLLYTSHSADKSAPPAYRQR